MSLATFKLYSKSLDKQTQVNIYLPAQRLKAQPVLFLLHGLSDDADAWLTMSSLARYADHYPFAIVMPDAGRSYYHNLPNSEHYWDYLTRELPDFLHTWFNWPLTKKTTFVAGLSMGGYGAFKMALRCPEKYGAAASLSGHLDLNDSWSARTNFFNQIFGSQDIFAKSSNNLLNLVTEPEVVRLPLYQLIGTQDLLLDNNRAFHTFSRPYLQQLSYHEQTGKHDWDFWDTYLPVVLHWLEEQYRRLK